MTEADPLYVEARRLLLDAIDALDAQIKAVVVAGAQAIYLRAGPNSLPVADYTTDGDIALDPTILIDEPALTTAMRSAGFNLAEKQGAPEPGIWVTELDLNGVRAEIGIDLIVPAAVAPRVGTRGALLDPHGKRAARKVVGLEAALVDNGPMSIDSFDPSDRRSRTVKVAGVPALIVAKVHKIADRIEGARDDRVKDKDAADVVRLMGAVPTEQVAMVLLELTEHPDAGAVTREAIKLFESLFGSRAGIGIEMAARSLRKGMPEERVRAICLAYASALGEALRPR